MSTAPELAPELEPEPPITSPRPRWAPETSWRLLGAAFLALYAFATLVPLGGTWGFHALGFFPWPIRIAALLASAALLVPRVQEVFTSGVATATRPLLAGGSRSGWAIVVAGVAALAIFYCFPIRTLVYGDAHTIVEHYGDNSRLPAGWLANVFDAHLLASKETLTVLFHRTLAHVFHLAIGDAYRIVSATCGALVVCLWLGFLRHDRPRSHLTPPLVTLGLVTGCLQIFFGHIENYAFAFLAAFAFLLIAARVIDGKASFLTALLLFLFAIKAHAATIDLAPAFLYLAVWRASRTWPAARRLLGGKALLGWLVVPSLVLATALYVFYFRSFAEPHSSANVVAQTFLPIVPPPPPMSYSLQSPAHLIDLGNVLLLVGAPATIIALGLVLIHGREIPWLDPRVAFATLAIAYPLAFTLTVNPALSMPRDWDLFCLLGAPLLLFTATVLTHGVTRAPSRAVCGTALSFAVFVVGGFALNASIAPLSRHLEATGEYVFRTYHTNSSFMIASAQAMEPDPDRALARRVATAERLAPLAVGEDPEVTHLLTDLAAAYRHRGDRARTVAWIERAAAIAPHDANIALWAADHALWAGEPARARTHADGVLALDPANVDALLLGAMASARTHDLPGAGSYLTRAAAIDPTNADVVSLTRQLREAERTSPER